MKFVDAFRFTSTPLLNLTNNLSEKLHEKFYNFKGLLNMKKLKIYPTLHQ